MSTPASLEPPRPPPLPEAIAGELAAVALSAEERAAAAAGQSAQPNQNQIIEDPGDQWLPAFLQDKSYATSNTHSIVVFRTDKG
jgi:hypothetical protein